MKDFKLKLLYLAFFLTLLGVLLNSFMDMSPTLKSAISVAGGSVIIVLVSLIGFDSVKFFTIKSAMGKAMLLISLGLISWGIGNIVWFCYNFFSNIDIPYPSFADVGYVGLIPLAAYGMFLLLKNIKMKLDFVIIVKTACLPLIVAVICYFTFVSSKIAENVGPIVKTLNVLYPVGDIIFLSFALIILSASFGSMLFKPLGIISLGFIIQAAADFSFSYTTTLGSYFGGCWVDLLWYTAFLLIGVGMHQILKSHASFVSAK